MPTDDPDSPSFQTLGLSEPLLRALADLAHERPTPIQAAVVPVALEGGDVWASAQTGSGKTAAFALPILESLSRRATEHPRPVRALVLAPTRELAVQIGEMFDGYARHLEPRPAVRVVFGGVSVNPQMMSLRGGADVVVATPGRLLDLVGKNALSLSRVSTLVLDEADRLLAQGFRDELDRILALVPRARQTLLFSATFPPAVQALAASVLRDPTRVEIATSTETAPAIRQRAIDVDRPRRTQLLRHILEQDDADRVLVFVATTYATQHVATKLRGLGVAAAPLHGKLSQGARTQALQDFRDGRTRVLVATDVAARGLDITGLPLVVNYDLPRSADDYVHRIGRTGRAGESGVAVSFIVADAHAHFRLIERRNGVSIPREVIEGFEPTDEEVAPPRTGGAKGKRKSKKDKLREAAARAADDPEKP